MARKPKSDPVSDDRTRVVQAVLAIAAEGGWPTVTLDDVAAHAGLSRARLIRHLPCPSAAVALLADELDRQVLDDADLDPIDEDGEVKDRLFDAMMRRFDALQDRRDGAVPLVRAMLRDPAALGCAAARAGRSMRVLLEVAGVSTAGPLGLVRIKGLGLVYAETLRAWMADDSTDMAGTMSTLDKALSRGERVMARLTRPAGRSSTAAADDKEAVSDPAG